MPTPIEIMIDRATGFDAAKFRAQKKKTDEAAEILLKIADIGKKWRRNPRQWEIALNTAIGEWEQLGG